MIQRVTTNYIAILAVSLLLLSCAKPQTPKLSEGNIPEVIKALTLEEKAKLLVGGEEYIRGYPSVFGGPDTLFGKLPTGVGDTRQYVDGAAGYTYAIPRLGISPMVFADGPAGIRISPQRHGDSLTYYTTAFPIETLLASSWNNDLLYEVGNAMGAEALDYGIDIVLAPALNIQRNPLGGRNFEYYSEDPLLSGKLAAAMVNGIQKQGVGACLKHFAANNNETNRMNINNHMDEQTLRELYLRGFEIAIKESKPWAVMSAYNKINGTYCSESSWLLTDYLWGELGFEGLVMSDWFAGRDQIKQVEAGNDLMMPGSKYIVSQLVAAVDSNVLDEDLLDRNVNAVLHTVLKTPRFRNYAFSNAPDLKSHAQVARQAAAEGMVLLKNNEYTLPFTANAKKLALFGNASYHTISGGSGSGDVNKKYNSNIYEALSNTGFQVDATLEKSYLYYIKVANDQLEPAGWLQREKYIDEYAADKSSIKKSAQINDCAIVTIGRRSGEFNDRLLSAFTLNAIESELLQTVSEAYHAQGKKVIVLLNIGAPIEVSSWSRHADAIVLMWQPGQEGGNALCDLLTGKVTPSGKLTCTFPVWYADLPNAEVFPGNLSETTQEADYAEGMFVGYRYFTSFKKPVAYPFGFGLSYTQFEYSEPEVTDQDSAYLFQIKVTNTGSYSGKEVVQLYVQSPISGTLSSGLELKGYAKTKALDPNESELIEIVVQKDYLKRFYPEKQQWILDKGAYRCCFSSSVESAQKELVIYN